jgi:hypothetical protein
MSRCGCPPDHAERALGHVVGGVRGVYDRHEFKVEKTRVLEALAHEVEPILAQSPLGLNREAVGSRFT